MTMQRARLIGTVLMFAASALAGCTTDGAGSGSLLNPLRPARTAAKPEKPAAPPIDMAGRWMLSSPGAGLCAMNFTGQPTAFEGRIAPEGGCPGNFFTSRGWALDQGSLVIKDHTGKPLASLPASTPPGSFEGIAASGLPITLAR